ncbi:isoleucine--tRNA ligase [Sesbania bispinosa]|nr:isoleucine--tRNA ligase [Sesbania bispinosa]
MDTTTTKENSKVLTETLGRWRCGGGRCQSRKLLPPSNEIGKSSEMEVDVGVRRSWGLMAWEMVVGFSKERRKTREKGGEWMAWEMVLGFCCTVSVENGWWVFGVRGGGA